MIFRQQLNLNSTTNTTTVGSGTKWGFGNDLKTKFSLQVTFLDGSGNPINPNTAEFWFNATNDNVAYGSMKSCDWVFGTQNNGDVMDEVGGPFSGIQINWNIADWGSAITCLVTFQAMP